MSDKLPNAPVAPDSGRWKPVQRGYPEGFEVLSEGGWVRLESLYDSRYLGDEVPFIHNGRAMPGFAVKDTEWGQWETNASFPRLASMDPATGAIVFSRPTRFIYHNYDGRLVRIKMKGVDILTSLFADLWLKPKYGRAWKYVMSDEVVRNNYGSSNYQLINKFSHDMYGYWSPASVLEDEVTLPVIGNRPPVSVLTSQVVASLEAPITLYPKKHAKRERVWENYHYTAFDSSTGEEVFVDRIRTEVPIFNVDIEPYHNVIIRKARKDENPRTLWVGGPVVVGDGCDKSVLRIEGIKGAATGGGSYSILRPDYRTVASDYIKK